MKYVIVPVAVLIHTLIFGLQCRAEAPGTSIAIAREGPRVQITFSGTLQSAPASSGPWSDLAGVASPLTIDPEESQRFYRIGQPAGESIFSSRSVVQFQITGPLQKHFELAFAGLPDGIFPPVREKPYFDASLNLDGLELPITLRVRGNSSLQECPFPKLKFKMAREHRAGTPFFDAREVKIGTHCAEGGQGNVGRLRDERAAFREALAYEVMEVLGFVGPRVRRARIDYADTTPIGESEFAGWQISRNALILDDVEVVAERMGGRVLSDEEAAGVNESAFNRQLLIEMQLFQALLGNWDYGLWQNSQGLWNVEVIELTDQQLLPVAGDFDLASWVTGEVRSSAPRDYRPDLPEIERQARYEVEQIQKRTNPEIFLAAAQRFFDGRAVIQSQIAAAEVDESGRTNALRHATAFFDSLTEQGTEK
jgi:hypothetical protein